MVALGDQGGAGNLVICEILKMHITESVLNEAGLIDPHKIDLVARMCGDWYCRANGDALFEVPKPLTTIGIGVDQIPADIRKSEVLTGNDLGMLGNVESIPDETDVNEYKLIELSDMFQEYADDMVKLEVALHQLAHELLLQKRVSEAWKVLLSFNN